MSVKLDSTELVTLLKYHYQKKRDAVLTHDLDKANFHLKREEYFATAYRKQYGYLPFPAYWVEDKNDTKV
jgi:hypothetical protein